MNAGFEEIDTVGNVVAEIFRGIRHAFRYERVGSKMHDRFGPHPLHQARQFCLVCEIALVKLCAFVHRRPVAFAEIVEHDDLVSGIQEFFHTNAADVAGPAGDENLHAGDASGARMARQVSTCKAFADS